MFDSRAYDGGTVQLETGFAKRHPGLGVGRPGGKGGAMPGGTYGIIGVLVAIILVVVLLRLLGVF